MGKGIKRLGWGGVVLSSLNTLFSRYLDYRDAEALGLSADVWLTIGLGVFFASVIALLLWWQKERDNAKVTQTQEKQSIGIEVFANREKVARERGSLTQELEGYKRVWAIWHQGGIVLELNIVEKCHLEKLILPNPNNDGILGLIAKANLGKVEEIQITERKTTIKGHIEKVAEKVNKSGDVRYYDGLISCTVIIADKEKLEDNELSDEAWVRIETGIPFQDTSNRPHILIYKKRNPQLVEAMRKHYIAVWDDSIPSKY